MTRCTHRNHKDETLLEWPRSMQGYWTPYMEYGGGDVRALATTATIRSMLASRRKPLLAILRSSVLLRVTYFIIIINCRSYYKYLLYTHNGRVSGIDRWRYNDEILDYKTPAVPYIYKKSSLLHTHAGLTEILPNNQYIYIYICVCRTQSMKWAEDATLPGPLPGDITQKNTQE